MEKERCEICKYFSQIVKCTEDGICILKDMPLDVCVDKDFVCNNFDLSERYKYDKLGYVNDTIPF